MKLSEVFVSPKKFSFGCVYKLISGNKYYVGRAINLYKRMLRHRWELVQGTHSNSYLQRVWNKYGEFDIQILFKSNKIEELIEHEGELLKLIDNYSMNLCDKPNGGHASGENHHYFGQQLSEEHKAKMSNSHKGKHIGEKNNQSKLKRSDILEIRKAANNGVSQAEIARKFNLSSSHICNIVNRKAWSHVK